MKVLHVRDAAGSDAPVELHPQITVVRGLDPARRAWLLDVLGRLAGGRGLPATGELDAHGIRFDLDDDALALLGLDESVPTVVTAADLPGHDPALAEAVRAHAEARRHRDDLAAQLDGHRAALGGAVEERDRAAATLGELQRGEGPARDAIAAAGAERSRLELELQGARGACEQAEVALAEAVNAREGVIQERNRANDRLEAARARRQAAIAAATQAAAAVEEARSGSETLVDPARVAEAARQRLAAAEQAAADADPDRDESPVSRRLADLERRRVELARLEAAMGEGGSESVAQALDGLLGASSDAPPVVAALALADTWRDLHQQISALEAGVSREEREAEERVAAARRSVIEAESDFNQPVLTPEQIAKVETSHTAVLEAQDRSEGRFGGSRARKRLEELRSDERRVLERLGFSTYADYMMSSSSRGVGPANRAILETARNNLGHAESQLTTLPGAGDRARRRAELLQRRDAVAPRVAELLGHEATGPEAEDELRNLREPVAADEGALALLAERLTAVGIDVGPAPHEREEVELLAKAYLAEERAAEAQRTDVTKAISALDTAVDDLRAAQRRGVTELPDLEPLPELAEPVPAPGDAAEEAAALTLREARWAEVESARTTVAEAEAEVVRLSGAAERLATLEQELADHTRAESEAASALAAAEAEASVDVNAQIEATMARVAEAEADLARCRAAVDDATAAITAHQGSSGAESLVADAGQRVSVAEAALAEVAGAEQTTAAALAEAEAALGAASDREASVSAAAAAIDRSTLVDDVEWELLSRLARVRSVGPGGSVPLVLDDPFPVLDDAEVTRVLDRLAGIAGAVQVVVISDRAAVADWAAGLGADRVGVHAAA
ncbi:hypothetical protein KSP35_05735 [Aquihabitans sp. G128]|uniref:hypothetical protein n=1 Tax=Aquihabitans sp. G128 TaxID=2849779 RepID=UPI001C216113|nr:hypothetical protein [Aquihabitans sp. G128]QXC62305.1 hypothetical protein KSP35_05735 [Aquihabitans sp. G128]